MLSVYIGHKYTTIQNDKRRVQWTLKTNQAFGDLYVKTLKKFPDYDCKSPGDVIALEVIQELSDSGDPKYIFGCREFGGALYFAETLTHGKLSLQLSIQEVDKLRIENGMTSAPTFGPHHGEQCMAFHRLNTITEVLISFLYYYAYSGLKLNTCRHCEKWFATSTLKEVYCGRISPCSRDILREEKTCKEAVHDIKQMQSRRRTNLYRYLYLHGGESEKEFSTKCNQFKATINRSPTVDHFREYQSYLYSEDFPKRIAKEDHNENT